MIYYSAALLNVDLEAHRISHSTSLLSFIKIAYTHPQQTVE